MKEEDYFVNDVSLDFKCPKCNHLMNCDLDLEAIATRRANHFLSKAIKQEHQKSIDNVKGWEK